MAVQHNVMEFLSDPSAPSGKAHFEMQEKCVRGDNGAASHWFCSPVVKFRRDWMFSVKQSLSAQRPRGGCLVSTRDILELRNAKYVSWLIQAWQGHKLLRERDVERGDEHFNWYRAYEREERGLHASFCLVHHPFVDCLCNVWLWIMRRHTFS